MSINGIYYPHQINFGGVIGKVSRFDSINAALNYEMIKRKASSDPYPCFVSAGSAQPEIQFTTPSIKPVLTACTDQAILRDLKANDVEFHCRRGEQHSMRVAQSTATHTVIKLVESAMLYWTQFNARESEDATISASMVVSRKDLATNPFLSKGTETLAPSRCENIYSLGPVIFNNRPLGSIHQVSWQNNVNLYSRRTANNPKDPCYQSIHDFMPVITCQTNDLSETLYSNNPDDAEVLDAYGGVQMNKLQVFLRRRKRTGFYYDDNTANHIEIRCFGGWKAFTEMDGVEPVEATLEFHCSQAVSSDGTVATDNLLFSYIDTTIPVLEDPKTTSTAPSLPSISNQNGTQNNPFFFQPEIGTGGLPYFSGSPAGWTISAGSLPTGLALDPISGIISGTPTATGTSSITLRASNFGGDSDQAFDIIIS